MTGGRVVRAPNHLGDVVLALPALVAAGSDVLVIRGLAPIVEMAGVSGRVLAFDRGLGGWRRAVSELRHARYEEGALLTPSFSAAWLMRWGGVSRLRGVAANGRSWMLAQTVERAALRPLHRINQFKMLLGQDTSALPSARTLKPPPELLTEWRVRTAGSFDGPLVGLFPGANAPARRWPVAGFAKVARSLADSGARIVVIGGPEERGLTEEVSAAAPGSLDLGGRTNISDLAAVLAICDLVVTNDTGPMHLAGAVGTRTVTLWGSSDPDEVRQIGAPDTRVTGPALPCKPCYRNECRRSGPGTLLDEAHEECMRLIQVDDVIAAVESNLAGEQA